MLLTPNSSLVDYQEGSIIIIDKPLKWTSFQVVNKVRYEISRKLNVKKIKVGHAGTLDPLASGILILCTGKATKLIDTLQAQNKEYTGTFFIGATTPSYDLETEIDHHFETAHINEALLEEIRLKFIGEQMQMPPIFSALKVDGKRAYKSAREGSEIEMTARKITINDLTFDMQLPELGFKVNCSKGTYIRSLAFDVGKALDAGAYMSSLRRTKNGEYTIDQAWNLDDLIAFIRN